MNPIAQYDGKTLIAKYPSISVAATATGVQPAHIGKVANGLRNTAGGYVWRSVTTFTPKLSPKLTGLIQRDRDGNVVGVYRDAEVASTLTGVRLASIMKVVEGNSRSAGGFLWTLG